MGEPGRAGVRIITGGQTGADRGALEAAQRHGVRVGGWIPKGRRAEDGPIGEEVAGFVECHGDEDTRTQLNVVDADGLLIVARGSLTGGTELARATADAIGRPTLCIDPCRTTHREAGERVVNWMAELPTPRAVNVAGPRASDDPNIQHDVAAILDVALAHPSWRAGSAEAAERAQLERHLEALYDIRWKDLVFADAKAVAIGASAASMVTAAFLATRTPSPDVLAGGPRTDTSFQIGVGAGMFAVLLVLTALLPRGHLVNDGDRPPHGKLAWLFDLVRTWGRAALRVFGGDPPGTPGTVYYREIVGTRDAAHLAQLAGNPDPSARVASWSREVRRLGLTCFYKYRFIRVACVFIGVEVLAFATFAIQRM